MIAKYNRCSTPAYRDDFFSDIVSGRYYGRGYASIPAVNIREENEEFRIEVAAPGIAKGEFKIDLNNDVLTVSSERKDEKSEKKENYTRREFNFSSFSRSFKLTDAIDQDQINATHVDGVLTIHLPKMEESVKAGPKSIEIS